MVLRRGREERFKRGKVRNGVYVCV
jgi:hypothetical protein